MSVCPDQLSIYVHIDIISAKSVEKLFINKNNEAGIEIPEKSTLSHHNDTKTQHDDS